MGGGTYSSSGRMRRSVKHGYASKDVALESGLADHTYRAASADKIFSRSINNAMNPHGVMLRESRDSEEHPESLAIIIALDVTGSMGSVPLHLVREGLPHIMETILERGVKDPQVLFLAIGDHECDQAPIQIGQFESSDELLDKWLTDAFLEGGGGGNDGESYLLAWYFAAQRTEIDCLEKRGKKGFLFTIGDEPTLRSVPAVALKGIFGEGQFENCSANKLLEKVREKYDTYHIHITETGSGSRKHIQDGWKQLMPDGFIPVQRHSDVADTIAQTIVSNYEHASSVVGAASMDALTDGSSADGLHTHDVHDVHEDVHEDSESDEKDDPKVML